MSSPPAVLLLGGHDPTSGAGIVRDALAVASVGAWPLTIPTALTVQDTHRVTQLLLNSAGFAAALTAILADIRPAAIKIGLLPAALVETVCEALAGLPGTPVVLDPVLASSSGYEFVSPEALAPLLPFTLLLTPNLSELAALTGQEVTSDAAIAMAAEILLTRGCRAVLVKGGHRVDAPIDRLFSRDAEPLTLPGTWGPVRDVHGTGCAYASLIAGLLALGCPLSEAVAQAHERLHADLRQPTSLTEGRAMLPLGLGL